MIMSMKRLTFIGIAASLFFAWGCKEEMVGPSIAGIAIDTFAVKTNQEVLQVDFSQKETVAFTGSWEADAKWIITITGKESGATKTLKGKDKAIDSVVWDGTSDGLFFKPNEVCEAVLSFENYDNTDTASALIKIVNTYAYDGIVLSDYETIGGIGWGGNNPITEDGVKLPQSQLMTAESENIPVPQGNTYLQMSGYETGGKYYLAGNSLVVSDTIKVENPTTTYINFFVYGYPNYYQKSTLFVFFRDKNAVEIGYQDRIKIPGIGWNAISIPLSKLKATSNGTGVPFDYNSIVEGGLSLFSVDGTECAAKCAVDYFILTKGYALFPLYN